MLKKFIETPSSNHMTNPISNEITRITRQSDVPVEDLLIRKGLELKEKLKEK